MYYIQCMYRAWAYSSPTPQGGGALNASGVVPQDFVYRIARVLEINRSRLEGLLRKPKRGVRKRGERVSLPPHGRQLPCHRGMGIFKPNPTGRRGTQCIGRVPFLLSDDTVPPQRSRRSSDYYYHYYYYYYYHVVVVVIKGVVPQDLDCPCSGLRGFLKSTARG